MVCCLFNISYACNKIAYARNVRLHSYPLDARETAENGGAVRLRHDVTRVHVQQKMRFVLRYQRKSLNS